MGNKYGVFLCFSHFLTIFILSLSFPCKATSGEERKVYIVYMGALKNRTYSPTAHHQSILESVLEGSSVSNSLVRSYKRSFNGFAAKLTERETLKLGSMDEIVSVIPNIIYKTQTTRSWDFMGLTEKIKRNPTVESDTIIGVIDTGIWPESESFSDEGFGPIPKKWKGACNGGVNFTCNNKLIGARFYHNSFSAEEVNSSRDDVGHGSHTASTAGGNTVSGASFYEIAKGSARGGVPSARIAAYKVCNTNGCGAEAIMAAFDDAIADGVDIITLSLGPAAPFELKRDTIAICAFHAIQKGILTTQAAGNSGPTLGSVSSVAPWVMAVAASSTDRQILDKLVLGNGATIIGHSVNSFSLNGTSFPLGYGENVKNASGFCSDSLAETCDFECLDSKKVKGKIVVCDSALGTAAGSSEALRAGAVGAVLPVKRNDVSFVVPLPASNLLNEDYHSVRSYLNSTKNPRGTILKSEGVKDSSAPRVASFSSRGPNLIYPGIVKPDISAPGVDILAAFSYEVSPSGNTNDKRRVNYNIISGTSMACPHVAGAAAYVKTFHPNWSPSAIKSSLMTTAWLMNNTKSSNGEFDYGSGHLNPTQAINPGLVFETKQEDYITFLCNSGYSDKTLRLITGDNSTTCPKVKGSPLDLNYPSMSAQVTPNQPFKIEFNRRVKNVGHANSTYTPQIFSPSLIHIKLVPEELSFKSVNEEHVFGVTVSGSGLSSNSVVSASVVWSDGTHHVRSPIVLHNIVVD